MCSPYCSAVGFVVVAGADCFAVGFVVAAVADCFAVAVGGFAGSDVADSFCHLAAVSPDYFDSVVAVVDFDALMFSWLVDGFWHEPAFVSYCLCCLSFPGVLNFCRF